MEALRFMGGIPTPPPVSVGPYGVGAGGAPIPAQFSTPVHASKPSQAQVSAGPLSSQRPYMFLRPLGRLWPGNGDGIREEKKSQEGHVASVEASTSTSEEEEERQNVKWILGGLGATSNGENTNTREGEHVAEPEASTSISEAKEERREANWVLNILRVRSETGDRAEIESVDDETDVDEVDEDDAVGCVVADDEEEREDEKMIDRNTFGKLLKRISLDEMRVYAKMSYLSNLTYNIKRIKVIIICWFFFWRIKALLYDFR